MNRSWVLYLAVACFGTFLPWPPAERAVASEPASKNQYRILSNIFATRVGFDSQGHCLAQRGKPLKHWRLPGFPARIPAFESCTTIKSSQGSREVDFVMRIKDVNGQVLQKIDGVLALSENGLASQALSWEHLTVDKPGRYLFEVEVDGQLAGRIPMRFTRRGGKTR